MFGDGGQDVDGQLVGVRVIHRHELHPRLHESRHEGEISREPIKLGDDQPGFVLVLA